VLWVSDQRLAIGFVFTGPEIIKFRIFCLYQRAYVDWAIWQIGFVFSNSFSVIWHPYILFRISDLEFRVSGRRPAIGFVLHNLTIATKHALSVAEGAQRHKGTKMSQNCYVPVCLTWGINCHFVPHLSIFLCFAEISNIKDKKAKWHIKVKNNVSKCK